MKATRAARSGASSVISHSQAMNSTAYYGKGLRRRSLGGTRFLGLINCAQDGEFPRRWRRNGLPTFAARLFLQWQPEACGKPT